MKDFIDKVVVIIGGATGIGKAMADKFGVEGAKVIISARRENRLQEAVKDLTDKGVDARYKVCDVSKLEDVKALADMHGVNLVMWMFSSIMLASQEFRGRSSTYQESLLSKLLM